MGIYPLSYYLILVSFSNDSLPKIWYSINNFSKVWKTWSTISSIYALMCSSMKWGQQHTPLFFLIEFCDDSVTAQPGLLGDTKFKQ